MSLRFNSCGNVDCTCSNHTKVPEYSMSDQVRANALPQRKLASPSNSKSEDNLYEMLDAFALEYLEAHMEPDYSISQRLQVESELVQDVKEQVKAWHKAEQAKLLAEIERLKNEP